jgi:hypothetical protein
MPTDPADNLLGLVAPEGADPPDGPSNMQAIIDRLAEAVGMVLIERKSPTSGVISFTSIPTGFRHLKLIGGVRVGTGNTVELGLRLNGDTDGAAYQWTAIANTNTSNVAPGGTITHASDASDSEIAVALVSSHSVRLTAFEATIHDASSSFEKSVIFQSSSGGADGAISLFPHIRHGAGLWRNPATASDAVDRVDVVPASSTLSGPSSVALYGIL